MRLIIGLILCGIAGGLAGYAGGWLAVLAVVIAEYGMMFALCK